MKVTFFYFLLTLATIANAQEDSSTHSEKKKKCIEKYEELKKTYESKVIELKCDKWVYDGTVSPCEKFHQAAYRKKLECINMQ